MKKITLLFVTLLAMSGMAFGQREAKLIWEREVNNVKDQYILTPNPLNILDNGSILTDYHGNARLFDKEGKLLWNSGNIDKFISLKQGEKINIAFTKDSIFVVDKAFSYIKSIAVYNNEVLSEYGLYEVEDGIIHLKDKLIIKYNFKGIKL